MLFNQMFEQVPRKPPYNKDPTGKPQVQELPSHASIAEHHHDPCSGVQRVGPGRLSDQHRCFDWSMGTAAGHTAFLNERVNAAFKEVLNAWGRFLSSSESTYVLSETPTGWFGAAALKAMPNFDLQFKCEPKQPHRGFKSWDDFFTREFRPGVRPVALPDDDAVIVNACESAPYRIARHVKAQDRFWIKSQPYSIVAYARKRSAGAASSSAAPYTRPT